jgi:hypothetical protein
MEEDQEPARIEIASPPGLPGALDTARAGEMARDAVINVAAAVSADHDYGGPLARTLRHLVHLSPEQLDRVAELAWELASLLDGGATHEDSASRTHEIRNYGLESIQRRRQYDCQQCRNSSPSWRPGVCRVCNVPAEHQRSYYCSEEHRLQDVRAGHG